MGPLECALIYLYIHLIFNDMIDKLQAEAEGDATSDDDPAKSGNDPLPIPSGA